jgi:hypothetical protein
MLLVSLASSATTPAPAPIRKRFRTPNCTVGHARDRNKSVSKRRSEHDFRGLESYPVVRVSEHQTLLNGRRSLLQTRPPRNPSGNRGKPGSRRISAYLWVGLYRITCFWTGQPRVGCHVSWDRRFPAAVASRSSYLPCTMGGAMLLSTKIQVRRRGHAAKFPRR